MSLRVLVTGGAGFIGSNLCRALSADGADVRVLDDLSTGRRVDLEGVEIELVEGSVTDEDLVTRLVDDADRVVHLAARPSVPRSVAEPVAAHDVNVTGTVRVLEAARGRAVPVVVAGSSSVYGDTEVLPKHEGLPTAPRSPYAASKVAAEAYALAYAASYGLPVLVLRFFNVYGPHQPADHAYAAVVPRFVDAALGGRPLEVHGDGHQSRDFTYVGTVVEVLRRAVVEVVTSPGPVNLAFGTRTDLLDLIAHIERLVGTPVEVHHVDPRPGDVRHSTADTTRLQSLFPDVEPVGLEQGLAETIAWHQNGRHERG